MKAAGLTEKSGCICQTTRRLVYVDFNFHHRRCGSLT